jgi:hypothetical protein
MKLPPVKRRAIQWSTPPPWGGHSLTNRIILQYLPVLALPMPGKPRQLGIFKMPTPDLWVGKEAWLA